MRLAHLARLALAALLVSALLAPGAAATPLATTASAHLASSQLSVAGGASSASSKVTYKKKKHKQIEKYVLAYVNKARAKAGLKKLARSAKIVKIARKWSVRQAERGELAHNPSYGQELPSGWTRASENVAWTTASGSAKKLAKRIVRLWLDSPGHRANILGSSYSKTGVGVAHSKRHGWYFTQNFSN